MTIVVNTFVMTFARSVGHLIGILRVLKRRRRLVVSDGLQLVSTFGLLLDFLADEAESVPLPAPRVHSSPVGLLDDSFDIGGTLDVEEQLVLLLSHLLTQIVVSEGKTVDVVGFHVQALLLRGDHGQTVSGSFLVVVLGLEVRGFVLITVAIMFGDVWVLSGLHLLRGFVVLLWDQLLSPRLHLLGKFVRLVLRKGSDILVD